MVHPSDGESWTHFDGIHHEKGEEASNVRVALATYGFNPYGMVATLYSCWPMFIIPLNPPSPPRGPISMTEHIHVIDYSRAPGE